MTVKELMDQLSRFNPDLKVEYEDVELGWSLRVNKLELRKCRDIEIVVIR